MSKHTRGPWTHQPNPDFRHSHEVMADGYYVATTHDGVMSESNAEANARLIAAAPDYHDAASWIRQAVAANAAPVNPLAALEELALDGEHITLDAGLVLDLLKAHAKATGEQQ